MEDEILASIAPCESIDETLVEMRILLDTNAYVALFRGHKGVVARVRLAE